MGGNLLNTVFFGMFVFYFGRLTLSQKYRRCKPSKYELYSAVLVVKEYRVVVKEAVNRSTVFVLILVFFVSAFRSNQDKLFAL